jgi:quercetin dioxygenase-like cupin family protein
MAIPHAKSGEVVDVLPLGPALAQAVTTTLVKTNMLEVLRLVIPAGKAIPEHRTHGEITVHCLEGRIAFELGGSTRELTAGQLLYVAGDEPHSLRGLEDASVLVTIVLRSKKALAEGG